VKAAITQRLVASSKPKDRIFDVYDDDLTGFILRIHPSGKKVYYVSPKRGVMRKIGLAPAFTPEQARNVAKAVIRAVAEGGSHPVLNRATSADNNPTLADFIDHTYKPHFEAHHRTTKNLDNLSAFEDLKKKRMRAITVDDVTTWRTARRRAHVKPSTINRNVSALKACLSHALDVGLLQQHPLARMPRLKVEEENRVRYLTPDEEARLREALDKREERIRSERISANRWRSQRGYELLPDLSNCKFADHFKPMVLLSLNTGVRQGELFSLEWASVVEGATITVQSGKSKSRRTRHVPLNKEARETIAHWRDQTGDQGQVFKSDKGRAFDNVRTAWKKLLADASITDFHWHDMRHHFASRLVMAGVPLNTVRELLGHSDIKMTLRYAHLAPGHMREAVELMAR
jgi:integrase